MKNLFLLLFASLLTGLFFASCRTTYTTESFPEKQLFFGSGGGFTGMVTEYLLLDNGQLYKHPAPEVYEELDRIKKKKAESLYAQYDSLGLDNLMFNQPGNIYYFIRMVNGENENYLSWSDERPLPEVEMMDFYKSLMETVRPKK
ncbi:MAG: hypothetical protein KDC85_22265 [Saprospiraceae bacterium]|nr:hypothetical protein [Saprospiraceae bacterium]MCB9325972.1 hypothetical protein [Lewinellaceae bacterium]